jgi:hypothetical protein
VPGASYDYVVKLVREFGRYPLQLGEYDLPEFSPASGRAGLNNL